MCVAEFMPCLISPIRRISDIRCPCCEPCNSCHRLPVAAAGITLDVVRMDADGADIPLMVSRQL